MRSPSTRTSSDAITMSSDGSRTTNSSRFSQFGLYRTIDARTEEFLRLSRKRQIRQGCACAAVSTVITVTVVVTILLVYEYTINIDSNRSQKTKKPHWHDILNDSSTFEAKIQKGNINLDPTTLKLLPMILKALNHNLIFDNDIEGSSPMPVSEKTDINDDNYSQNQKNTFTNWLRTPNTIDYRPHYKTPTNLDYYSKIRKIRNYQKVLSLFDKLMNNKMSMTSSEVTVEELTDKPKASKEPKENDKKKTTYSTRPYSSQTRRTIMIRKATQSTTIKRKTTAKYQSRIINMKNKKCGCSKNLRVLLSKVMHSIQDVLPELALMVKVPCNDSSVIVSSGPTARSTNTSISSSSSEVLSVEDNDVSPTKPVTVLIVEPFTTINPNKNYRSYINNNKAKKHLKIDPHSNIYLGLPMQKLNFNPEIQKKNNLEKWRNFYGSSTENRKKYIDSTEVNAKSKLFTVPMTKVPTSVTTIKMSPTITTTITATTKMATTTNATTTITATTATTTNTPMNTQDITDMDILPDDDEDEYLFPTQEEEITILNSSSIPQELSEFNPHILELLKSNILRSRPKKKKFTSKEPNTYLDQVMENSSIYQKNMNGESKEELNLNTSEQYLPTMVDNIQLQNKIMRTNELVLDSPNTNNTYQQISDIQQTVSSLTDLNPKDKFFRLPLFEKNLIKSRLYKDLEKNTMNYVPAYTATNFQESTFKNEFQLQTLESSKSKINLEKNTTSVNNNSDKVDAEVEQKVFKKSTMKENNIVEKEDINYNIVQEFSSYERLSRKEGMLKGNDLEPNKNLTRKTSNNDRKSSPLSKSKGETHNEVNNYMSWLENVGHPVNVMTSNWLTSVVSSSIIPNNSNFETPWDIKKIEYNENSSIRISTKNSDIPNYNQTQPFTATTWSYILFNEDNKTSLNYSGKEIDNTEIEMPDSENLLPVQEIPLSTYFGNSFLPEKLKKKKDIFPDEPYVDNSPSFLKSMLPHNRPIYLEIARRDWKKDVKEYDSSKEPYTDVY